MPNSCSSLVFVKLFVWHEKLFLVNAKLFQCQIVAAPWSTWNCSFSGLSSWQPTTCLSSDLSISGELFIHIPLYSLSLNLLWCKNSLPQALLASGEINLRQLQVPRPGNISAPCAQVAYTFLFRHFQYFSSASPWPATWSASYLSLYTGCSSQQAPMSGSSMSGTQVAPRHKLRFPINASFFQKRAFAFRRCSFGFSLFT